MGIQAHAKAASSNLIVVNTPNSSISYYSAYQIIVKGKVIDRDGVGLPGVTVKERGTNKVVLTSSEGTFSINLSNKDAVLEFSSVGYFTKSLKASDNLSAIFLESISNDLDEVVVVGYGTQKKSHLTGAVSSIKGDELESRPVQNTAQALQGLIPGLNVQTSGLGGELN